MTDEINQFWEKTYRLYLHKLYKITGDYELARDCLGILYLKLSRMNFPNGIKDEEKFKNYVADTICRQVAVDYIRRNSKHRTNLSYDMTVRSNDSVGGLEDYKVDPVASLAYDPHTDEEIMAKDMEEWVKKNTHELYLYEFEDKTALEISIIVGANYKTVRTRLARQKVLFWRKFGYFLGIPFPRSGYIDESS